MDLDCTTYHNLLSSWDDGTKSNDSEVWWIWIDRGLNEEKRWHKEKYQIRFLPKPHVITKVMNVNLERCQKQ